MKKIVFDNEIDVKVFDKDGQLLETYNEKNMLTDEAKRILTENLVEVVHEAGNSNKMLAVVLGSGSISKSSSVTLNDITSGSDDVDLVEIDSSSYLGSGVITYGVRYSFESSNSTGSDITYKTFGLVTGYSLADTDSHNLFSILNCDIDVPDAGSFSGNYTITVALRRQ